MEFSFILFLGLGAFILGFIVGMLMFTKSSGYRISDLNITLFDDGIINLRGRHETKYYYKGKFYNRLIDIDEKV